MSISSRSDPAFHLTVMPDGFVTDNICIFCIDNEGFQPQFSTRILFLNGCFLADEICIFIIGDKAIKPGFQWTIDGPVFSRPGTIVFFESEGIQGSQSEQTHTEGFTRFHQSLENGSLIFCFHPDFIAEISGITDPANQTFA